MCIIYSIFFFGSIETNFTMQLQLNRNININARFNGNESVSFFLFSPFS